MFPKTFALMSLAASASAHIIMTSPKPYGVSTLNNSPLDASGSDFPCKRRTGDYNAEGASNVFAQGSTQKLAFKGTTVHGGGSCQVSVTTDAKPDKNSVWKVIQSIEGGCPAQDQTGNMGDNPDTPVPYTYNYTIPDELAAGDYTLAWTWFNKVGNREMYMNCAPLTVTGGKGDDGLLDTLPDMFVANIGNGCGTDADTDVKFPDPGSEVVQLNGATNAFKAPNGVCPTGSGGGSPAPTDTPTDAPEPPAPTTAPASPTTATAPGGIFITTGGAPDAPEPTSTEAPAPTQPADPPAETPPTSDPGSGSGGFAVGTACSPEGDWNCVGGSSFQRCASGAWSAVQALSAGTSCEAGQATELKMVSRRSRQALRRALRDLLH